MPTTICGPGGTASPKPGAPAKVAFGGSALTGVLLAISPWLIPFAALLDTIVVEVELLCGQDPPPMPVWGANDLLSFWAGPTDAGFAGVLSKVNDELLNYAWPLFCDCNSAVVPPTPVFPGPPPGIASPSGNNGTPCFSGQYAGIPPDNLTSDFPQDFDATSYLLSTNGQTATFAVAGGNLKVYGIPAGTTEISYSGHNPLWADGLVHPGDLGAAVLFYGATGTFQGSIELSGGSPTTVQSFSGSTAISSNQVYWIATVRKNQETFDPPADDFSISTQVWCNGSGPGLTDSCCPPDPSLLVGIQTIISLLQRSTSTAVPAYTRGTAHAGITGTGTLNVSGLFGMLVELTAGVPTTPQLPGVPPYQFSVGWMSVLTPDGMIDEIRLTRQAQVWAPALMPLATVFGFQLNQGFTATFTELVPAAAAAATFGSLPAHGV